jgi:transposase
VQGLRAEYFEVLEALRDHRFVFLDVAGCRLGMDCRYARAPGGERAHCVAPFHRGDTFNLIGALGTTRLRCMFSVDGTVNGEVFTTFAKKVLAPRLRRDDVVIMDNLSVHKVAGAIHAIEERGAKILFLPPYSPDLNPIEMLWSKLKQAIRRAAPKTVRAFNTALKMAIDSISEKDIRGWVRHCGCKAQSA